MLPAIAAVAARLGASAGGRAAVGAAESGLAGEAESAAVQQIGAQLGSSVGQAPANLRAKMGALERMTESPSGMGTTAIDAWFPSFGHTIYVAVSGGPQGRIKDIWQLAVATAFGRFRNRIATWAGAAVDCVWDITDKSVAIRISYGSNGLVPFILGQGGIGGTDAVNLIQKGPTEETIGGTWADFIRTFPQLYDQAINTNAGRIVGGRIMPRITGVQPVSPTPPYNVRTGNIESVVNTDPGILPDDGRLITTAYKKDPHVQPPRPPFDATLVAVVSQALGTPCYLPCPPPPTLQVDVPLGYRFYMPGQPGVLRLVDGVVTLIPNNADQLRAEAESRRISPENLSNDGYPVPDPANYPSRDDLDECLRTAPARAPRQPESPEA
jgi:hypothetical protein